MAKKATKKPGGTAEIKREPLWWISPDLRYLARPIEELSEDPENARIHGEQNLASIRASLESHGQQKAVVARKDGTVIAGNGTLATARSLGWTHLAVSTWSGSEAMARRYAVADNRTAELATWDAKALSKAIEGLEDDQVAPTGWTATDLREYLGHAEPSASPAPSSSDEVLVTSPTRQVVLVAGTQEHEELLALLEAARGQAGCEDNSLAVLTALRAYVGAGVTS